MFKQAIVLLSFPLVALAQPMDAASVAEAQKQAEEKCTAMAHLPKSFTSFINLSPGAPHFKSRFC